MPDMERVTRSLELHAAETNEEAIFTTGRHQGLDMARRQIAVVVAVLAVFAVLIAPYVPH